jgi:hypothetical protein
LQTNVPRAEAADNSRRWHGVTATGTVPQDCHPKIRRLFEYWRSIHPAAGLPGRQHFDPLDVPLLLPSILLADVAGRAGPEPEFTFRLMGTQLEVFFGGNFTGRPFVSAFIKARQSQTYIDMRRILEDRQPLVAGAAATVWCRHRLDTLRKTPLPEVTRQRLGRMRALVMMEATAAEDAMEMLPCLALSPNPDDKKAFETARKRKGGQ